MDPVWLPHVRSPKDNWAGVTDVAERRRLQSRLAQRARRAKNCKNPKIQAPAITAREHGLAIPDSPSTGSPYIPDDLGELGLELYTPEDSVYSLPTVTALSSELSDMSSEFSCVKFSFSDFQHTYTPSPYYSLMFHCMNATAALWRNADALHIKCANPSISILMPDLTPPRSLSQGTLQLIIPHQPYIDVIPFSSMRDRILGAQAIINQDDLRSDLVNTGLKCWGRNPLDSRGWELSEEFVNKWWFLLDEEIVALTNWWHLEREDEALVWKGKINHPMIGGVLKINP